jgi:chromosomal replication initiation ATPase DnaA
MKDSDQTLENFFEFGESSTAVALLRSMCKTESTEQENPPVPPLLLYGNPGFGKTHLARACAQELRF